MTDTSKTLKELDDMEARVQAAVEAEQRDNESRWGKLYGEWLRQRATYAEGPVSDEESDRIADREAELVREMIATPSPSSHDVLRKIDVLQHYMDIGGNWTDHRDTLLLASIRADVAVLS
jgi:hypothetical protein